MGFNVKKILSSRPMQGNPGKFYMWNPELWALESRIHLKESGIALMIEILKSTIQVPLTKTGNQYLESGIWNPWHGIQNSRLSWIPIHGATLVIGHLHVGVILLLHCTTTRILQGIAFFYKLPVRLLYLKLMGITNFEYERKNKMNSGLRSKKMSLCKCLFFGEMYEEQSREFECRYFGS